MVARVARVHFVRVFTLVRLRYKRLSTRTAAAPLVHEPEDKLRDGMALLGRFTEPCDGGSVILRDAFALSVHRPEIGLRLGVAGVGTGAQACECLG